MKQTKGDMQKKLLNQARKFLLYTGYTICMKYLLTSCVLPGEFTSKEGLIFFISIYKIFYLLSGIFYCFTMHFDSLNLIHTNQCTFSYKDVLVF